MLIAPAFEREDDSITSLSAALALLLIINPYSAASLGLQLTFAATLGIVLFAERIYESVDGTLEKTRVYRKKPAKRAIKAIIANLSTTIGASIFTIPIVAVRLNYMSVAAPLTNLLVAWAVSAVFILGLAALILGFIFVPVGTAAAFIAGLPARYVIWVVRTIASGRFASVYTVNRLVVFWMIYAAVVFLLFYIYRKELIRVVPAACLVSISLCAILLFTYIRYENREMTVTVLDVGQGQSIVVTSGSATAVIDCGSSSGEDAGTLAAQYLRSIGRKNAEIFILTHYHADHANGADEFMELIDVDTLLAPDESISDSYLAEDMLKLAEEQEVDVIYVENRMTVSLGDAVIELYPPLGDDDENELGIVAVCTAGDYDVLVTGDIPSSIERRLVHDYRLPDTEVFIAGHHGSKYSNSYDLLNAVKPETVIISVGNNTYGHPTDEALERFAAVGAEVYRTDFSGNITIDTGDKNGRKKAG